VEREASRESIVPLNILEERLVRSYKKSLDFDAAENFINSSQDESLVNAKKNLYSETYHHQPFDPFLLSKQIKQQLETSKDGSDQVFWHYLKEAIDQKDSKEDQHALIDNATSILNIKDPFQLNIQKLTFVARTQKALGMNYKRTVDVLYQTMESFFSEIPTDADPDDNEYKLERVEAIMCMEDTISALIEIGNMEQAKRLLEEYGVRTNGFDDEGFIKGFIADSFVEIVRRESQGALTGAEIENIDREQVVAITRSKNVQALEALGYFDLVDEETYSSLNEEAKLSLTIGKSKKQPDENLTTIENIFSKSELHMASKALTSSLTHLDNQKLKNKVKDLLDIARSSPSAFRRLLKGLLEAKDSEGKKMATELFLADETPDHYKLYLAKKLCGLGLWDRQINFYFRGIQNDVVNSDQRHRDTLKAIITQMHMTPSLPIYKVLEKTRQQKNGAGFDEMAQLGAKIFSHTSLTLESKVGIFSKWSEAYNAGELDGEGLLNVIKSLEQFSDNEEQTLGSLKLHKEDKKTQFLLRELYGSKIIIDNQNKVPELVINGIYPTEKLIGLLRQSSLSTVQLSQLKKLTENGQFDPNNPFQKELEFLDFVKLNDKIPNNPGEVFDSLHFYDHQEIERELSLREQVEAEAAALEAANLYWFIRARVERGRKMTVVGNQRYGDYFVMEPLRSELQDLGVSLSSFKIGSSGSNEANLPDIFPQYFIEYLAQEKPDIVIIDGTSRFKDGKVPRLPSSFYGYLNWFKLYNQIAEDKVSHQEKTIDLMAKIKSANPTVSYRIAQWSPQESEDIVIGNSKMVRENPDYESPNVIFANPIIDPETYPNYPDYLKEHQPAFLDDPEKHIGHKKAIAFTAHGVKAVIEGSISEMQFANSVQNHMIKKLSRFIRETDPVFKD